VAAAPGYPDTISPDGRFLVYHTPSNVAMLQPLDPVVAARPLVSAKPQTFNAEISPDGRWIAYQSDESGRFEIYVQPFPAMETGRWQVSESGGVHPLWASSGRELFFIDDAGMLTSLPVQTVSGFAPGKAIGLFPAGQYVVNVARAYDVSPDGSRFVFVKTANQARVRPSFVVVSNWFDEVRDRMGTR
jgi:Tol biopolymer transport system component